MKPRPKIIDAIFIGEGTTADSPPTAGRIVAKSAPRNDIYRQEDGSWVAEVPAVPGCYALMPLREEALSELSKVFQMITDEQAEKLPA